MMLKPAFLLVAMALAATGCGPSESNSQTQVIRITAGDQPAAGALVQPVAGREFWRADDRGRVEIPTPHDGKRLAAWLEGYYIATAEPDPARDLQLQPLPAVDDPNYAWIAPRGADPQRHHCADCHPGIVEQWESTAHAQAATNPRFLSLYTGQGWHGQPAAGWSLLDDHPLGAGVCAACHVPTVEPAEPAWTDLRELQAKDRWGIHCDVCHKVLDVRQKSGTLHGRFALQWRRDRESLLFAGPWPDAVGEGNTYAPVFRQARFCASCHEGIVFGVPVYTTFSEWQVSPAGKAGRTCQSCHMASNGRTTNVAPDAGGVDRPAARIGSHGLYPGGVAVMRGRAVSWNVTVTRTDQSTRLHIDLWAQDVGHAVPTGFIDRHLVLLISADDGSELSAAVGPRIDGRLDADHAGQPGWVFGKWLERDGEPSPVAFWQPYDRLHDDRLVPGELREFEYSWEGRQPPLKVELLYRRFWPHVRKSKDWPDETEVMKQWAESEASESSR